MTASRANCSPRRMAAGGNAWPSLAASGLVFDYRLYMHTNATMLSVWGGIAVRTQFKDGYFSDPDPVPLEAVRGAYKFNGDDY